MKTTDERFEVKEGRPGTGRGLYALKGIPKGDFVIEYTGERIPTKEADESGSRYLFEIDSQWTVKGPPSINLAGYINHSCDPNTEAQIELGDDGEDHINFYAIKRIKKGDELTIDYGEEYFKEFIQPVGCKCAAKKHQSY